MSARSQQLAASQADRDPRVTVTDDRGESVTLFKPPHVFTRTANGSGMHWFREDTSGLYRADTGMHPRGLAWLREHYAELSVMGLDAHLYESLEKP